MQVFQCTDLTCRTRSRKFNAAHRKRKAHSATSNRLWLSKVNPTQLKASKWDPLHCRIHKPRAPTGSKIFLKASLNYLEHCRVDKPRIVTGGLIL